jgi:GNAT superfamily N-acetyltransferase
MTENPSFSLRPARAADKASIAQFTQDTFDWGDYVTDRFDRWLEEDGGLLMVGADEHDTAVAICFASRLSDTEVWFQGIRVREDWRRKGIARAMTVYGSDWAREQGALVVRLAVEDWNSAARGQVENAGFRNVGGWVRAIRTIGEASPLPAGNGGRRVPANEQLVRAHASEAAPAYMSWSTSPLARTARGLFAVRWQWRRLTETDLQQAAKHGALWMARSGWVMAAPERDRLEVAWLETREDDAVDLMRSVVDLASKLDAERIGITIPAVPWLTTAARRAGCELHPMTVYETSL